MSKKILQFLVIFLGILIILSFIALIYGMYLKISKKSKEILLIPENISINLTNTEKIQDIRVIDENRLLIIIKEQNSIKGAIYDIKEEHVYQYIKK